MQINNNCYFRPLLYVVYVLNSLLCNHNIHSWTFHVKLTRLVVYLYIYIYIPIDELFLITFVLYKI